ncbi:MAG: condensation domain-containing protein, partial [Lutisporaceae bacterium]
VNNYGPTENTVVTTSFVVDKEYDNIPIGKPIANTQIYIIDKENKLQPIGVPGELCIAGESLARGYINNPELTAEKFIENPFVKDQRLYKTGDLARWLPDGNIEFLGRIDNQVKIRGYRIELGEIEARILSYEGIEEAIVIAREDKNNNKYLCGYIVAAGEEIVTELKDYLAKELPEYMIPAYFIQLDRLPLTANGKVDGKALPEPDGSINAVVEYAAPTNEIEEILATIWQEVLGIEKVGLNDNFFSLGGDSIKAIQVTSRLYQYNMKLDIKQIFQNQTINKISKYIEFSSYKSSQEPVTGITELTPIQKWFFEHSFTDKHHWNQAVMLNAIKGLDEGIINKVFSKILEHHDVLRATYEISRQEVKQVINPINEHMYDFEVYDFRNISDYLGSIKSKASEVQASIDLEKGPLVKLALFKTTEGDYLLIAIHHLVVDGVSWRIIIEDFATGYNQCLNNQNVELQLKTDSYKAWAEVLNSYSSSDEILKEIEYWTALENSNTTPISDSISDYLIAKDSLSVSNKLKDIEAVGIEFSVEQTEKLLKEVNSTYNTEINDILLSALGYTLKEWAGNTSILIGLEGHGREESVGDINIKRTVGWFTSTYPVILDMSKSGSIAYQIKSIKESLRHIPNKGIGYGLLKYLTPVEKKQKLACSLRPEISFNYLGQFEEKAATDIFNMSGISSGNSMSLESEQINLIDINGIIAQNKLVLNFSYSKQQLTRDSVLKLAEYYKNYLADIIEHCINAEEAVLTPSDITLKGASIEQLDNILAMFKRSGVEDVYNLSPMQQGMLFHSMIDSSSNAYFEQTKLSINGCVDLGLFEESFNYIIEKYAPLRTVFLYEKVDKPLQVVLKKRTGNILYNDISSFNEAEKQIYIEDFKQKDKKQGFDLSNDLLMRISVIKTDIEEYEVIWSFHHIIMDGWCLGIIMGDFFKAYSLFAKGNTINAANNYPYSDYIKWLQNQNNEEALTYWKNYLQDYEQQVSIPKLYKKINENIYLHQEIQFELNEAITGRLTRIARENHISLNVMLQTVWGILLQRYNNTKDVVFGAVVSGRPPEINGIENMVGLFINTIPVRIQTNDSSFIELAKGIQQNASESMTYDYLPLADIQANTELKNNLFDHLMVFENYPMDMQVSSMNNVEVLGFSIKGVEVFEETNYDFNLAIMPGETTAIKFSYNENIYSKEQIERIYNNFNMVINQVIENPEINATNINIIDDEEKHQVLVEFNNTKTAYPKDKTIQQLFEAQAEKTPNNIAVVFDSKQLTYKELNEKANIIARTLRSKGIKADDAVAILVDKSIEMIIGVIAILKAGGAYLPIDTDYPVDRIEYILKDSGSSILLTQTDISNTVNFNGQKLILDNQEIYNTPEIDCNDNLEIINKPNSLAYIMYTSGSTGKPKGVMVEHKNVIRLVKNTNYISFNEEDKILQTGALVFDASTFEIWGA